MNHHGSLWLSSCCRAKFSSRRILPFHRNIETMRQENPRLNVGLADGAGGLEFAQAMGSPG
jgi:hypothetical protein